MTACCVFVNIGVNCATLLFAFGEIGKWGYTEETSVCNSYVCIYYASMHVLEKSVKFGAANKLRTTIDRLHTATCYTNWETATLPSLPTTCECRRQCSTTFCIVFDPTLYYLFLQTIVMHSRSGALQSREGIPTSTYFITGTCLRCTQDTNLWVAVNNGFIHTADMMQLKLSNCGQSIGHVVAFPYLLVSGRVWVLIIMNI